MENTTQFLNYLDSVVLLAKHGYVVSNNVPADTVVESEEMIEVSLAVDAGIELPEHQIIEKGF